MVDQIKHEEWIAVDLDGTLAVYTTWKRWDHIGAPIPRMVERVRQWIKEGIEVRIFTARVGFLTDKCKISGETFSKAQMTDVIQRWSLQHIGPTVLEVTATKDFRTREIWDDRAVQVVANTGITIADEYESEIAALKGKP